MKEKSKRGKDEEVNGQGGKRGAPAPQVWQKLHKSVEFTVTYKHIQIRYTVNSLIPSQVQPNAKHFKRLSNKKLTTTLYISVFTDKKSRHQTQQSSGRVGRVFNVLSDERSVTSDTTFSRQSTRLHWYFTDNQSQQLIENAKITQTNWS